MIVVIFLTPDRDDACVHVEAVGEGRTTVRVVFATWLMQAEGGKKQDGEGDKDSCWCSDWICSQRPMIVVRVW